MFARSSRRSQKDLPPCLLVPRGTGSSLKGRRTYHLVCSFLAAKSEGPTTLFARSSRHRVLPKGRRTYHLVCSFLAAKSEGPTTLFARSSRRRQKDLPPCLLVPRGTGSSLKGRRTRLCLWVCGNNESFLTLRSKVAGPSGNYLLAVSVIFPKCAWSITAVPRRTSCRLTTWVCDR